jgi:hypothetical protein
MACEKCKELCVRFAIRHPQDLRRTIEIAKQNIQDGTIVEIQTISQDDQIPFSELNIDQPLDDYISYRFRCISCGELFYLHVETYHGSGGYWEPENHASINKDL